MTWIWLLLAFVAAVAGLALGGMVLAGTESQEIPWPLRPVVAAVSLGLLFDVAAVWVHVGSWQSFWTWPAMWVAPVGTAIAGAVVARRGAAYGETLPWPTAIAIALAAAVFFALPALLLVAAGRAPGS